MSSLIDVPAWDFGLSALWEKHNRLALLKMRLELMDGLMKTLTDSVKKQEEGMVITAKVTHSFEETYWTDDDRGTWARVAQFNVGDFVKLKFDVSAWNFGLHNHPHYKDNLFWYGDRVDNLLITDGRNLLEEVALQHAIHSRKDRLLRD